MSEVNEEEKLDPVPPHRSRDFSAWLARQSLPRLLGLLFGTTRELEQRLDDKDRIIGSILEQVEWWKRRYVALEDSYLLSQGHRPTDIVLPPTPPSSVSRNSNQHGINVEVDKLMELMSIKPLEADERVADLIRSTRPRDKEILRRFMLQFQQLPPIDDPNSGVIIPS